jgi:AraC-like DNA-binding protein
MERAMSGLCTVRLANPVMRALSARGASPEMVPERLRAAAPDDRVPVAEVHETCQRVADQLGEEQLGLELGATLSLGEVGTFDYLLRSAPTVREALDAASRYSTLTSDTYHIFLERWRGLNLLRMLDESSWTRVVADMAMTAAYRLHVGERVPFTSELECWFPYATPVDTSAYERSFPGATLRFDAPFHAFAFDDSYLQAPQLGADPLLHSLLRERLDAATQMAREASALRPRVRLAIERLIRQGEGACAPTVARSLHMSRRTLSRRLQHEDTTFADELDAVRREMAMTHVCDSDRPFAEIAYLLGFAHVESFHRAFKRWTGTTPLAQRTRAAQERGVRAICGSPAGEPRTIAG